MVGKNIYTGGSLGEVPVKVQVAAVGEYIAIQSEESTAAAYLLTESIASGPEEEKMTQNVTASGEKTIGTHTVNTIDESAEDRRGDELAANPGTDGAALGLAQEMAMHITSDPSDQTTDMHSMKIPRDGARENEDCNIVAGIVGEDTAFSPEQRKTTKPKKIAGEKRKEGHLTGYTGNTASRCKGLKLTADDSTTIECAKPKKKVVESKKRNKAAVFEETGADISKEAQPFKTMAKPKRAATKPTPQEGPAPVAPNPITAAINAKLETVNKFLTFEFPKNSYLTRHRSLNFNLVDIPALDLTTAIIRMRLDYGIRDPMHYCDALRDAEVRMIMARFTQDHYYAKDTAFITIDVSVWTELEQEIIRRINGRLPETTHLLEIELEMFARDLKEIRHRHGIVQTQRANLSQPANTENELPKSESVPSKVFDPAMSESGITRPPILPSFENKTYEKKGEPTRERPAQHEYNSGKVTRDDSLRKTLSTAGRTIMRERDAAEEKARLAAATVGDGLMENDTVVVAEDAEAGDPGPKLPD